jgi:hypothetical protein
LGGPLLVLGWVLIAGEASVTAALDVDVGPWGGNFVVLGAIISACGFWLLWPHVAAEKGVKIAVSLIAIGVVLFVVSFYGERVLMRIAALIVLVSGVRGVAYHVAALLPRMRHDGVIPLGEKAALFSLLANGGITTYLVYRSQEFGPTVSTSEIGFVTTTALVVGSILVAESLVVRFLRASEDTETLVDERDAAIGEEAGRLGHTLLITVVVVLAVQLALGSALDPVVSSNGVLGLSSPVAIAHSLLALLFIAECGRSATEIWLYRRARI